MTQLANLLLITTLALNFFALGASRLRAVIHAVALQGALFGVLPLVLHPADISLHGVLFMIGAVAIKGFVIPALLLYAMREADIRQEDRPLVHFIPSLLLGAVGTALAMLFADTLPLLTHDVNSLLVPTALSTVLVGFLVLITRTLAINQVLGYLILENGIFTFGMLLVDVLPFLVEMGVLLDLSTGVFVMGIIIHHINREFASVSTEHLAKIKE